MPPKEYSMKKTNPGVIRENAVAASLAAVIIGVEMVVSTSTLVLFWRIYFPI
jgi:hypothetical protein